MIRFRVNGIPAPQGSKRHVGNGRMVESSRAVGPWREAVRAEASMAHADCPAHGQAHRRGACLDCPTCHPLPRTEPLSVTIVFVMARPKSHMSRGGGTHWVLGSAPKYPATRPDVDKLARAVLDGLVMGGVMADDAQVVSLNCAKVYASNGEAPGAVIEVEAM